MRHWRLEIANNRLDHDIAFYMAEAEAFEDIIDRGGTDFVYDYYHTDEPHETLSKIIDIVFDNRFEADIGRLVKSLVMNRVDEVAKATAQRKMENQP